MKSPCEVQRRPLGHPFPPIGAEAFTIARMAKWLLKRRLTVTSTRLKALRDEIAVADEQIRHLRDDAEDAETRAIVSENSAATREARQAREQVDAMRAHRDKMANEVAQLERQQDELLDQLTASK
jgi:predicted  nucleic acid-binding Zn-ribbon protein